MRLCSNAGWRQNRKKKKKTDAGESLSMSPSDKHQRENKEASKGGLKCVEGRVLDMGGQNFPLFTPKRWHYHRDLIQRMMAWSVQGKEHHRQWEEQVQSPWGRQEPGLVPCSCRQLSEERGMRDEVRAWLRRSPWLMASLCIYWLHSRVSSRTRRYTEEEVKCW